MTISEPIRVKPCRQKAFCKQLKKKAEHIDKMIAEQPWTKPGGDWRVLELKSIEYALSWITPPDVREELNK
jgi:hypothetical protein